MDVYYLGMSWMIHNIWSDAANQLDKSKGIYVYFKFKDVDYPCLLCIQSMSFVYFCK